MVPAAKVGAPEILTLKRAKERSPEFGPQHVIISGQVDPLSALFVCC